MKTQTQILIWQEPDATTMDCKLNAEIVLFINWDDMLLIGWVDIPCNNFHTNPDIDDNENGNVYYLFNDVKEFAILKKATE